MRRVAPLFALAVALAGALCYGCRAQTPASATRDDFRKLVMADRKPAPLNPQTISSMEVGNARVERVKITTEEGQDAVVLIHRPKTEGRFPTVVFQHFLGGTKEIQPLLVLYSGLASKGYLVAAIDGRYRGERQNGKSLETAMVEALRSGKGHPFLIDTVFDDTRLLDYLQTRPDVDTEHLGMAGFSEGGIETWMTAAIDERIKVAVPVIGVTTFGEALSVAEGPDVAARLKTFDAVLREYATDLGEKEVSAKVLRAAWEKLVPGMLDKFDAPKMLPLIAPRPLLILSHELDELFPVAGARTAYEATRARYKELSAEDKIDFRVAKGQKHAGFDFTEVTGMMQWLDRWLKPAAAN